MCLKDHMFMAKVVLYFKIGSSAFLLNLLPGTAVGKLLTLGGFGVWWVVDIILLVLGELRPADDSNWEPFY